MVLHRDVVIVAVTLAIAAALYVMSFRDLAAAYPAGVGSVSGATLLQAPNDPDTKPALAG